jgi:hypothetical protein
MRCLHSVQAFKFAVSTALLVYPPLLFLRAVVDLPLPPLLRSIRFIPMRDLITTVVLEPL